MNNQDPRLNWYYERLQTTGRSQNRLLWTGFLLFLFAIILIFDNEQAAKISFLGIPLKSIERVLPAAIFLVLAALQGNFTAVSDPIKNIEELIKRSSADKQDESRTPFIKGIYSIDKYLNFIDFITFAFNKRGWNRHAHLLYPCFIILVGSFGLILLLKQSYQLFVPGDFYRDFFFTVINAVFGLLCYVVSIEFIKRKIGKFRRTKKNKKVSLDY